MFEFIPQITGGMTYDNNIYATSINHVDDFIWSLSPGLTVVAQDSNDGKIVSINYVPTFVFYTDNTTNNYIAQSASVTATLPLAKLTLGLGGTARIQQSAVVGTGQLVQTRDFGGEVSSKYAIGAKTSIEVNGQVRISEGDDLIGHDIWSNNDWINYAFSEKLSLGLGCVFGYVTIQDQPHQTFEDALIRADYTVSEKLSLNASAGPEWRQYDGQSPDTLDPVVTIGGSYRVREGTTLNLEAVGAIHASLNATGQNYYGAGVRLDVVQRLSNRFTLTAGAGYENDRYYSVSPGVAADEPNDLFVVGGMVTYQIRERWTANVFYNYRRNSGNASITGFNANQAGIQTSWRY